MTSLHFQSGKIRRPQLVKVFKYDVIALPIWEHQKTLAHDAFQSWTIKVVDNVTTSIDRRQGSIKPVHMSPSTKERSDSNVHHRSRAKDSSPHGEEDCPHLLWGAIGKCRASAATCFFFFKTSKYLIKFVLEIYKNTIIFDIRASKHDKYYI
jgi:hypothetical protein